MFKINDYALVHKNPTCKAPVDQYRIFTASANYFDKDGFELTQIEKEFYLVNGYPVHNNILNHCCYNEPWMNLVASVPKGFILDHCIVLHRCNFTEAARDQLLSFKTDVPKLSYLLQCKQKWGLDLALDYFDGEAMYEVIHIEQDFHTSEECTAYKENIEKFVLATYWKDAAKRLKQRRTIGLLKSDLHRTIGKPDFLVSLKQN